MKINHLFSYLIIAFSLLFSNNSFSQGTLNSQQLSGSNLNTITTAVPFLLITPDSRSGAMGDVGVAISPDANAIHWKKRSIRTLLKNSLFEEELCAAGKKSLKPIVKKD